MYCSLTNDKIPFDNEGKIEKTINKIAGSNSKNKLVLLAYLESNEFKEFIVNAITDKDINKGYTIDINNFTNEDYVKINGNKLTQLLKYYYYERNPRVDNTVSSKSSINRMGFSTGRAKIVARDYTSSILLDICRREISKFKPKSAMEIIGECSNYILSEFNKSVDDLIIHINNNNYSEEAKSSVNAYSEYAKRIKENKQALLKNQEDINNLISFKNNNIKELNKLNKESAIIIAKAKRSKDKTEIQILITIVKDIEEKINELKNKNVELSNTIKEYKSKNNDILDEIKHDKFYRDILAHNIVNNYSSEIDESYGSRLKNYANLVMQTRTNSNSWFDLVFSSKRLSEVIEMFRDIDNIESYINSEENDDSLSHDYESEGIDLMSQHWNDSGYKHFSKSLDNQVKVLLSTIPNLSQPYNYNSNIQSIDTDNELGVPTYMSYQYVAVQIYSFGDFSSVDNLISSLEEKCSKVKDLYGIGKLVAMMKKNRNLANRIYSNFSTPIVHKTMVIINDVSLEDGIEFDYSNPNAFALTELTFKMMNRLKATYNNAYDINDSNTILEIMNDFKTNKEISIEDLVESIYDGIIYKYFPNIKKEIIYNYLSNDIDANKDITKDDRTKVYNRMNYLYNGFEHIFSGLKVFKENLNNKLEAIQKENKKLAEDYYKEKQNYDKAAGIVEGIKPPTIPNYKKVPYDSYEFNTAINQGIITLSKLLIDYSESKARLNTTNGAGNTSSDVIKNCFVSRVIEQIKTETKEDSNAGLKAFLNYITQGPSSANESNRGADNQYAHNPLFFGIKDLDGKVLAEGMFSRNDDSIEINNNAKQFINFSLFDGVKNNRTNEGTTYAKMNKTDFFITQYRSFVNGTKEITDDGYSNIVNNTVMANYAMRIGSDAPKIFFIRAPKYNINTLQYAFYQHTLNELNIFINALNRLFVQEGDNFFTTRSVDGLTGNMFYNEKTADIIRHKKVEDFTKSIVKNGKLVGNAFKFFRLFNVGDFNMNDRMSAMLSLYGGSDNNLSEEPLFIEEVDNNGEKTGRLSINLKHDIVHRVGDKFVLNLNDDIKKRLLSMTTEWMNAYDNYINDNITEYTEILDNNGIKYNINHIKSFLFNSLNMNITYDDLFEGDFKYYKNARDFLKRTKQTQAGGHAYTAYNVLDDIHSGIHNLTRDGKDDIIYLNGEQIIDNERLPVEEHVSIDGRQLIARNGFRAVTMYDTTKVSDVADEMQQSLERDFIEDGMAIDIAKLKSNQLASGYGHSFADTEGALTKMNDAQSYITFDEFIRRKSAEGTIDDYADLIRQLTDPNVKVEDIDIENINARIQVQKNFYYDKIYNPDTGLYEARQIKNAEFVLIPKLLPKDGDLIRVYNWMVANDIGQLNTAETSKASKKNLFTIWDEQTGELVEDFESKFEPRHVENYFYQYLYKQQDVPQHIMDETNKIGVQISKKIIDNIYSLDDSNPRKKKLIQMAQEYQKAYATQYKQDFAAFLDTMGWEYDKNDNTIINSNYATTDANGNPLSEEQIEYNKTNLNFTYFWIRAREEAARLGMDSNFIKYLTTDERGKAIMPSDMNTVVTKLESIAQALYSNKVGRQTLPGWHAAQITGIGYSKKLKFDPETGVMEVLLPRWNKLLPKTNSKEEEEALIKKLEEKGLDIHLGYRIPTEGKQSIAVFKVVGFVNDCLGSTIVVPDEWVIQTGSDFDVDSIYGISWEMTSYTDKQGNIHLDKIPHEEGEVDEEKLYIKYVNDRLESKVKKDFVGGEIKDAIQEIKNNLQSDKLKNELSDSYKELDDARNKLYGELPKGIQSIIINKNKTLIYNENGKADLVDLYNKIIDAIEKYVSEKDNSNIGYSEEVKDKINQYNAYLKGIVSIVSQQYELGDKFKDELKGISSEIKDKINSIIEQAKKDYFNKVESYAKDAGLLSYKKWNELPFVEKLDRRARNNYMIYRMIELVSDRSSREEQYGRSNFDDVVNGNNGANDVIDKLYKADKKSLSPYNPLTQLDYFEDVMSGVRLKAISVNWDGLVSQNNYVRTVLSPSNAIFVTLETEEYLDNSPLLFNKNSIIKSYPNDVVGESGYIKGDSVSYNDDNIEIKNTENPTDIKYDYFLNMNMSYGDEKRNDIFSTTTIHAIFNRERTATTRYTNDAKKLDYYSNFKIGDIIKFTSDTGEFVYVRVTKPFTKLSINTNPEEWSKKEGWDIKHFNNKVLPHIKNGEAYQLEYEYIGVAGNDKKESNIKIPNINKPTLGNNNTDLRKYTIRINATPRYANKHVDTSNIYDGDIFEELSIINGLNIERTNDADVRELGDNLNEIFNEFIVPAVNNTGKDYILGNKNRSYRYLADAINITNADAVFAMGYVFANSKVSGDIEVSIEIAKLLKKPIYVNDGRVWYNYNYKTNKFEITNQPVLNKNFVGLISDDILKDKNAIKTFRDVISDLHKYTKHGVQYNNDANIDNKHSLDGKGKGQITVRARKLGWSKDNIGFHGNIITSTGSHTTAHHLDAVKTGSIPNVDEYTFGVYKMFPSLGIDYESAIGVIRQPIITKLVRNKNKINSIFINDTDNAIRLTLVELAQSIGLRQNKYNSKPIDKDTNLNIIIDSFINDPIIGEFINHFTEPSKGLYIKPKNGVYPLVINRRQLFNRIKREVETNDNDKGNIYKNAAYDFCVLMTFVYMNNTANKLNNIMSVSNADKYKARPSIKEARDNKAKVEKLRLDETLITEDGKDTYINKLFPKLNDNDSIIDIENSSYPSLAAAYNYTLLPSLKTNVNLFKTEQDDFVNLERIAEACIDKDFTIEQHKEFKKYFMSYVYNQIGIFISPITLDKHNNIIPNFNLIAENKNNDQKYWNEEVSRIFGYGRITAGDINIENIYKPTETEIYNFTKLSPAQKVLFIQQHFNEDAGLFEAIKVTSMNSSDIKKKGISRQYLNFDDQVDDIENILVNFIEAYDNTNPLIKLAAIDLVKYAAVAEGFNFKSGYISKIIPNEILLNAEENGGLGAVTKINEILDNIGDYSNNMEFIRRFVRSHSYVANMFRLDAKFYNNSNTKQFLDAHLTNGIVKLDKTTNENLFYRFRLNNLNKDAIKYIRVSYPNIDGVYKTTLFEVIPTGLNSDNKVTQVSLIPLNLLDEHEVEEYSFNSNNNEFNEYSYYEDYISLKTNDNVYKPIGSYNVTDNNVENNPNVLQNFAESGIGNYRDSASMIIEGFLNYFDNKQTQESDIYVQLNNGVINNYFPLHKEVIQYIRRDDVIIPIRIVRTRNNKRTIKYLNDKYNSIGKLTGNNAAKFAREKEMYNTLYNKIKDNVSNISLSNIYTMKLDEKEYERLNANPLTLAASSGEIVEEDTISNKITVTGYTIINHANYRNKKYNNPIAKNFIKEIDSKGINKNRKSSIYDNRDYVYKIAARYYKTYANSLIQKLNEFELNGKVYSMDDPELYKELINNPDRFNEVSNIILESITFGRDIMDLFSLDLQAEDLELKHNIESIIQSVNNVSRNKKLKKAMDNIINIYFANYSTNPMIKEELITLRETFGDTPYLDSLFADPADINNKEVQVILKKIYGLLAKAEMFDIDRNIKEWKDALDEIEKMSETLDISHVIDFDNFSIKQSFTNEFIKERNRLFEKVTMLNANKEKDLESYKAYVLAKLEKDIFMYENMEQPIIDEYYRRDIIIRRNAIEKGGDDFIEYLMLTNKLYNGELTDDEKTKCLNRIKDLKGSLVFNEDGNNPVSEAINEYIKNKRELNKEFFEYNEYDGFRETYKQYKEYIDKYNKKFPERTIDEKLEDEMYKEAFDWIKSNGSLRFSDEYKEKLDKAFAAISGMGGTSKRIRTLLKRMDGVVDKNGNINPLNLSDEALQKINEIESAAFVKDTSMEVEDFVLLNSAKNITKIGNIASGNKKFDKNKGEIIQQLNSIFSKAFDRNKGIIDVQLFFNDDIVSNEERNRVVKLMKQLALTRVNEFNPTGQFKLFSEDSPFEYNFNSEQAYSDDLYYYDNLQNSHKGTQYNAIFKEINIDGNLIANPFIYARVVPKDEYINKEKTDTLKFIKENIDFTTTEYYDIAKNKAIKDGTFEEWFKINHYYNPYTHVYKPLSVWTTMSPKPGSELADNEEYVASRDNTEKGIKKQYINNEENRKALGLTGKGYSELGYNYKERTGKYNTNYNLNDKEKALRNLLIDTLNKYTTTYKGKRFISQGYLPRVRNVDINGKYVFNQALALLGISGSSGRDSDEFYKDVDYIHDRDANFNMLSLLEAVGTKKYERLPLENEFKSKEDYLKKLAEVRERNRQIQEENEKIDSSIVNKNWKGVMETFINNATIFNSRQASKNYFYLLIEDLVNNDAYTVKGILNKRLVKDSDKSSTDDVKYMTTEQTRTKDLIHNLARRVLFEQHHENSTFRTVANFLQNATSAKYMIFNVYGGAANIAVGKANIAAEYMANEYFSYMDLKKAEGMYLKNSISMITNMYSDDSSSKAESLIKHFKVVDFDQMLQFGDGSANLDTYLRRTRNLLYSFQSVGEHYMQNTALLAMTLSNKLYTDSEGVRHIGDFNEYSNTVEIETMKYILKDDEILSANYDTFINIIKNDQQFKYDIETGKTNINRAFLLSIKDNNDDSNISKRYKEILDKYNSAIKDNLKKAREKFNKEGISIYDIYDFVDGKAVINKKVLDDFNKKGPNKLGDLETLLSEFRNHVIQVNNKIHGVYDKRGAAKIEKYWFGSIIMQYRKHLWNGIMKIYRKTGFYNEFRTSRERGAIHDLVNYLSIDFRNYKKMVNNKKKEGELEALASIQTAMTCTLNAIINYKENWHLLSPTERKNIHRMLGYASYALKACLIVILLCAGWDDDEIKQSKWLSSILYLSDRLYNDSTMFTPTGLISEAKTAWTSPTASANGPSDLIKAMNIITSSVLDPDFESEYKTGRYAGENKLAVVLRRNIPGIRPYDRIQTITDYNNYYKVGEQQNIFNLAKNIGEELND